MVEVIEILGGNVNSLSQIDEIIQFEKALSEV